MYMITRTYHSILTRGRDGFSGLVRCNFPHILVAPVGGRELEIGIAKELHAVILGENDRRAVGHPSDLVQALSGWVFFVSPDHVHVHTFLLISMQSGTDIYIYSNTETDSFFQRKDVKFGGNFFRPILPSTTHPPCIVRVYRRRLIANVIDLDSVIQAVLVYVQGQ